VADEKGKKDNIFGTRANIKKSVNKRERVRGGELSV